MYQILFDNALSRCHVVFVQITSLLFVIFVSKTELINSISRIDTNYLIWKG